jgi:hypothetical protein
MKTVFIKRNDLFDDINMVMFNNINQVDESFIEDNHHLFDRVCDKCDGSGAIVENDEGVECDECSGDCSHDLEPYQYFICNLDSYQEEQLKDYDVLYGYSERCEAHIIPIYDLGTSWGAFSYSKEVEDDYILAHNETLERTTFY